MRFFLLSLIYAASLAEGKLEEYQYKRGISPNDAGAMHTAAFEELGNIYKNKRPSSDVEFMLNVGNVMSTFCPKDDPTYQPHRVAMQSFQKIQNGAQKITYPSDFDKNLQTSIENTFTAIKALNVLELDEVMGKLASIRSDLEEMDYDKEIYHMLSLGGVSIAMESAKLWHSSIHDSEHDLHKTMTGGNRRLQGFNLPIIVASDIVGFIEGGLTELVSNATAFFHPDDLIRKAVLESISTSAGSASNMTIVVFPNLQP